MTNALIYETATLPCQASPGTNVVWYYQQYCDHFQHGLYACSSRTAVSLGHEYQIRTNTPGEHSLLINGVTKNMTGVYTCENSESHTAIHSMLLNVICKYSFISFRSCVAVTLLLGIGVVRKVLEFKT